MSERMSEAQFRRAGKLIRRLCANYDGGNCLPLDDGDVCPCLNFHISRCQPQHRPGTSQKTKHPHRADSLADDSGHRRPLHAHITDKNQYGIQNNIADRSHHCGNHAEFGKSLRGDKRIQPHDNHYKYNA